MGENKTNTKNVQKLLYQKGKHSYFVQPIGHIHRYHTSCNKGRVDKKVVSHVKPLLNEKQKKERISFCINNINLPCFQFLSFNDTIHIDEKWFYLKKVNQTMYLGPKETKPIRKTQNKRFLKKVMFLVAVGVPRMNHTTSTYFDGKTRIPP